jgi:hypothetical protein
MAENKKSILVYSDWMNIFEQLEDEEAGKLIKHFFKYVNDLNPEAPDRLTKLLFEPIKQTLKRDLVKYEDRREKNRQNALKRWDDKDAIGCDGIRTNANNADSVSDSVSDSVNDKRNKEENIIPPTLGIVKEYCKERNNNVDPEKWFNFYEAKGWMIGKNKMKDWRAAVRTWEKESKIIVPEFKSGSTR